MRRIPSKTRKLINRSGFGHCDLCEKQKILVEHHINGRDIPDAEKPWNKCHICPDDHAEVHYGRIIIEGWVSTTSGKKLAWHRSGEVGITGMDAKPYVISQKTGSSKAAAFDTVTAG